MINVLDQVDKLKHKTYYYEKYKNIIESKGGECISPLEDYETARSKFKVKCQDDHLFVISGYHLLENTWCGKCNVYQREQLSIKILEHLTNEIFNTERPEWLRYNGGAKLELDGFNQKFKIGIEVQGIQHYKRVPFFHKSQEDFEKRQEYDQFKRDKCKELGITLFEIPYTIELSNLYNYIVNLCLSHGYEINEDQEFDLQNCYKITPKIAKAKEIIEGKGGKLITNPDSINILSNILVECKVGHIWKTCMKYLKKGNLCPKCARFMSEDRKIKISNTMKEKKCGKCKEIKTIFEFHKGGNKDDGYQSYCKICMNAIQKETSNESSRSLNIIVSL